MCDRRVKRFLPVCVLIVVCVFQFSVQLLPAHAAQKQIYVTTQRFEHGLMLFRFDNADVWVLLDTRIAYKFTNTDYNHLSDQTPVTNSANHIIPIFSFGKIWRNLPQIRGALGWAALPEIGFHSNINVYQNAAGAVIEFPQLDDKVIVAYQTQGGYAWSYGNAGSSNSVSTVSTQAAFQAFDNGYMIWRADTQEVLVFPGKAGGQYRIYPISQYGTYPENQVTDAVPTGHVKPINAFGRVWSTQWLQNDKSIGWPTGPEQSYSATIVQPALHSTGYGDTLYEFSITIPDSHVFYASSFHYYWTLG